jgi:hypothetical protein
MRSFQSLILGGALVAGLALGTGCHPGQETSGDAPAPPSGASAGSDADSGSLPSGSAIADSMRALNRRDSPPVPIDSLPDAPDDLLRYLRLTAQQNFSDPALVERAETDRLQAANKLLQCKLDDQQHFDAIQAKLDALIHLAAAGNADARQEFYKFTKSLRTDDKPRVAQMVAVAELLIELDSRLARQDRNIDSVIGQALAVASQFPDSSDVCIGLFHAGELIIKSGARDDGLKLFASLASVYENRDDPRIAAVVDEIRTRVELASLDLDTTFNQIRDGHPQALEELKTKIRKLFEDPSLTRLTLDRINNSVDWLELQQQVEATTNVNQLLDRETALIGDGQLQSWLREMCAFRQTRLDLAGQLLPDQLHLADGTPLDRNRFAGNNVVVVFWSPAEPVSVDVVRRFAALRDQQTKRRWELLGVCLTRNPDVVKTLFGGTWPQWPNVTAPPDPAAIAAHFGVSKTPHIMLLDDQQRFVSTSFPLARLPLQLQRWSAAADEQE